MLQEELEAAVPSSTIPSGNTSTQASQTQIFARSLRSLLDDLREVYVMLDEVVEQAKATAEVDDIGERVLLVSSGFDKLAEVQPAMFEDILEEELSKYDKFRSQIEELELKHGVIVQKIVVSTTWLSLSGCRLFLSLVVHKRGIPSFKTGRPCGQGTRTCPPVTRPSIP